jgi:hypothetical protein
MQIRARLSMSVDGYVTAPSGWPLTPAISPDANVRYEHA